MRPIRLTITACRQDLLTESRKCWDNVVEHAGKHGLRNAQISVIAPTGTISFLMDCDTTGIEPDIALVKYKWLVGGGMLKMVNQTVPGTHPTWVLECTAHRHPRVYRREKDRSKARHISNRSTSAYLTARSRRRKGARTIHYMGHVRMMAAVQPFISGAISKR